MASSTFPSPAVMACRRIAASLIPVLSLRASVLAARADGSLIERVFDSVVM